VLLIMLVAIEGTV